MNDKFQEEMHYNIANSRLSSERILYISLWEWRNRQVEFWNFSRATAEYLYEKEKGIKRMSQAERERLQTARCKFVRKYALRKPNAR